MPSRVAQSTIAMTVYNLAASKSGGSELERLYSAVRKIHFGTTRTEFDAAVNGLAARGRVTVAGDAIRVADPRAVRSRDRTGDGWDGWVGVAEDGSVTPLKVNA